MKKNNNKIRVLILGADGFIGSNLTYRLLREKKYIIRAFDRFKNGQSKNLNQLRNKIELFAGDFLNRSDIKKSLKNIDYVFHFLSSTTPGSSMEDPLMDINTNVCGMLSLLDECVKAKVKKVIFSSSGGAVYGNQDKKMYSEKDNPFPISPYGISKLTIEKYLEYYKVYHGLDYLVLRYSNIYGPRQNIFGSQGIIPIFLNLVDQGNEVAVFGDGKNVRDYIYIDDAIEVTMLLFNKKTQYHVYNVGSSRGFSINEILKIIGRTTGKKIKIKWLPKRNIDIDRVVLDMKKVLLEVKYLPKVDIDEGIRKTLKWIRQEMDD
jgi:UDP-glucose 4-epimerase